MTKITRTGPGPVFPPILPSKIGVNNKGPRPFPPPCLGSLAKGYKLLKITLLVGLTHAPLHMCLLPDCTEPSINQQMRFGAYQYKQARTRHRTYHWVLSSSAYCYLQSTNNIAGGKVMTALLPTSVLPVISYLPSCKDLHGALAHAHKYIPAKARTT